MDKLYLSLCKWVYSNENQAWSYSQASLINFFQFPGSLKKIHLEVIIHRFGTITVSQMQAYFLVEFSFQKLGKKFQLKLEFEIED